MKRKETIYYLEMTAPSELRPARRDAAGVEVKRAEIICPELNRSLYTAVGGDWFWVDRLAWSFEQWREYLQRPGHETWIAYVSGTSAGYFELDGQAGSPMEIAYFGLLPQFTGRGLGGHLLTVAVERAWQKQASKVWLHTSSFDHPAALANYQRRGFRMVKVEEGEKDLPDQPPGAWPGARRVT